MDTNITEEIWEKFLSELENKQAFNDMLKNHQMPLIERQQMFKNYLELWSNLHNLEKGTSDRLFDFSCEF